MPLNLESDNQVFSKQTSITIAKADFKDYNILLIDGKTNAKNPPHNGMYVQVHGDATAFGAEADTLGVLGYGFRKPSGSTDRGGTGVMGAGWVGVHGESLNAGVGTGVEGVGGTYGVHGSILPDAQGNESIIAAAVYGESKTGRAVLGSTDSGIAVEGAVTNIPAPANSFAGAFLGPVQVQGPFTVFGPFPKSAAVAHPDGSHRLLYCMESPDCWFEDIGESQLVDGKADVSLDPDFAAIVDTAGYHVFISPYGESKGLYVSHRTHKGFVVQEQHAGKSNIIFSYRVAARRRDIQPERFASIEPVKRVKQPETYPARVPDVEEIRRGIKK